jgi:hypothetical protein
MSVVALDYLEFGVLRLRVTTTIIVPTRTKLLFQSFSFFIIGMRISAAVVMLKILKFKNTSRDAVTCMIANRSLLFARR